MDELIRKRGRVKAKLTRICSFADQLDPSTVSVTDVDIRLDMLGEIWSEFDTTQTKIECQCDDQEITAQQQEQEEFEAKFCAVKSKLLNTRTQLVTSPTVSIDTVQSRNVRLPIIELPTFAGHYQQWAAFSDLFKSVIHDNQSLMPVQKLHYLKSAVRGEAARLLSSIANTEANYIEAWEILKNRYSNKRQIIQSHLKSLYAQPALSSESAVNIRRLLDCTVENIRALHALGMPTAEWDCLLVFLITERLDTGTRRQWELSTADEETPSFNDLKEFLEKRCRALEAAGLERNRPTAPNRGTVTRAAKVSNAPTVYTATTGCIKCKSQHPLFKCDEFLRMPIEKRIEFIKAASLCFNCFKSGHGSRDCKLSTCKKCSMRHNTLLHKESGQKPVSTAAALSADTVGAHYGCSQAAPKQIVLATAIVKTQDSMGNYHQLRALLDSGSQATFITEACVQRLRLKRRKANITIGGLGATCAGTCKGTVQLCVASNTTSYQCELQALVFQNITGILPLHPIDPLHLAASIMEHQLSLADPDYHHPGPIDLLMGADIYYELLASGNFKDSTGAVFQNTQLGWIISGPVGINSNHLVILSHVALGDLGDQLKTFWEIEAISQPRVLTEEEAKCEKHFKDTHSRNSDGRFIVHLPFHNGTTNLGDTFTMAKGRLLQVKRRLSVNPEHQQGYHDFLAEYLALGHMEPVRISQKQESVYYLPHHCVIKDTSSTTKLRIVFDGTAKPATGRSLNEALMVGPTIQNDIFDILMRFRVHTIAFTADIAKMYRQVLVCDDHCDYQRILWYNSSPSDIQAFRLKTLTYGTASAPFLAIRCLKELATSGESEFTLGAAVLQRDFYVDDLISGAESLEEALAIQSQLIELLRSGGFELRKWASNDQHMVSSLHERLRNQDITLDLASDGIKTLGIYWQPGSDRFIFKVKTEVLTTITKRTILSQVSKLFDPLGWLAPVVLKAKIMIQQLWLLGVGWDANLPPEIIDSWKTYQEELPSIQDIQVARQMIGGSAVSECQLHGFCDASETAYGAVVYVLSVSKDGPMIQLVCSKSKVAPLKTVSIPRLELCGAVLLAQLLAKVGSVLSVSADRIWAWTDSTVVLAWLRKPSHNWKTFVANRVVIIQDLIAPEHWRHVCSSENPADCLSRGLSPTQIKDYKLWWNGPTWLIMDEANWPPLANVDGDVGSSERKKPKLFTHVMPVLDQTLIARYSSLDKLIRVTAYCWRFVTNCKSKERRKGGWLSTDELRNGLFHWIRVVQSESFHSEIQSCIGNSPLSHSSALLSLNPFVDDVGILRVGGRLQNTIMGYNSKHPIILPHRHLLTDLIVCRAHLTHLHAGPQLLLAVLQKTYWILRARQTVRHLIFKCVRCCRLRAATSQQLMGSLPQSRVEPSRAFLRCGIDYAGPLTIRPKVGRGNIGTHKAYVCIFVCFVTHAIHIELVNDLTTQSFIAALRRFVSRRGRPSDIYSDRGTNFVGAQRELKEFIELTSSSKHNNQIAAVLGNDGIAWHFSPPASPHFGGLWEAGVKSIKYHLRRVVGLVNLTYEELYTVLTQIEACLNSRPLCPLSSDPADLGYLTPGHFLIGDALTAVPDRDVTQLNVGRLTRWELTQRLYQHFWKRWSGEYVARLQQRPKWTKQYPNLAVGDLILMVDTDRSPLTWPMARVIQVHPGNDNLVRTVTVQSQGGVYKRAVTKCCRLPIESSDM